MFGELRKPAVPESKRESVHWILERRGVSALALVILALLVLTACESARPLYLSYANSGIVDPGISMQEAEVIMKNTFEPLSESLDQGPGHVKRLSEEQLEQLGSVLIDFIDQRFDVSYVELKESASSGGAELQEISGSETMRELIDDMIRCAVVLQVSYVDALPGACALAYGGANGAEKTYGLPCSMYLEASALNPDFYEDHPYLLEGTCIVDALVITTESGRILGWAERYDTDSAVRTFWRSES